MRLILKSLVGVLIVAAIATSTPAVAQASDPDQPSAADLATASAAADALIANSGAPDLFLNVSSDGMAKVRHTASGLICSFVPGAENNTLRVFNHEGFTRGDDVGCNADIGPTYLTYYATRYGPGYSAADSAREAAAAIRNRFPDARPYEGAFASVEPPPGVGQVEYVAMLIGPETSPRYTHALVAKVGEWTFKQRMTGEGGEDSVLSNQIMGAAFFNAVLQDALKDQKP